MRHGYGAAPLDGSGGRPISGTRVWTGGAVRVSSSVDRLVGLDRVDPADDAATDMDRVGEARGLQDGEDFRTADTGLAVQDDPLVLGQVLQSRAHQELVL